MSDHLNQIMNCRKENRSAAKIMLNQYSSIPKNEQPPIIVHIKKDLDSEWIEETNAKKYQNKFSFLLYSCTVILTNSYW